MSIPFIPVFISSPNDVDSERKIVRDAVNQLSPCFTSNYEVPLVPYMWETASPIAPFDGDPPQVSILQQIDPFSIFVVIVNERYGTPFPPNWLSGTETEIQYALSSRDRICILSYFHAGTGASDTEEINQEQRRLVAAFKGRLDKEKVVHVEYADAAALKERVVIDLVDAALKLIQTGQPRLVPDYRKIFRFGSHARAASLPLLIVYPPMTDPGPGHELPKFNWRERLLPHVIYEDFKAIQDIEQVMRLLRRHYKTVTTDSPSLYSTDPGDRVWVCVPRNRPAREVLENLGDRVRFEFLLEDRSEGQELVLRWRRKTDAEPFLISSPLGKYLAQSNRPSRAKAWYARFGYSYGRDYAIFARFRVPRNFQFVDGEYFYHYFVGGIRGLGTWGVGHLIDHESSHLVQMIEASVSRDEDDFQLLLEVTYENFRIKEVREVGNEPEQYFTKQNSDEYIEDRLDRRGHRHLGAP